MSTVAVEPVASPVPTFDVPYYLLTSDQFEHMIETGTVGRRDKVVLWKGRLFAKMTKHPPHGHALGCLAEIMGRILPAGYFYRQDISIRLDDRSMPEPDLIVIRGDRAEFARRRATPGDIAILVEVADSSLPLDRRVIADFAAAGIVEYWIVNLVDRRIEIYSGPDANTKAYRTTRMFGPDDEVPVVLDGHEVGRFAVKDILP